jgi:hypothetical protein
MADVAGTQVTVVIASPRVAILSSSSALIPTAEEMFNKAIALTLAASPDRRADLFEQFVRDIVAIVSANPEMRPWNYTVYDGIDGSRIFCGGIGLSLVIDPNGRLWRARTYEDFDTTYTITPTSCEVASMRPKYEAMREYLPR